MLLLTLILIIFNVVFGSEPLFGRVIQLTFKGDHSFPSFSRDSRAVFFTAKNGPYSRCEHVYRMDRRKPSSPVSLISTGIGREFQATQIGTRYSTVSTALKELGIFMSNSQLNANEEMFCPDPKCKTQTTQTSLRDLCAKPHLERLSGSTVLRMLGSGVLINLNYQTDLKNGWVSNEAWHEENKQSFGRVFSASCDHGECITIEDQLKSSVLNEKQGWYDGFTQYGSLTSGASDIGLAFSGTFVDDNYLDYIKMGVIPLNGSKIYKTTFKTLFKSKLDPIVNDPNYAYMYPTFDPLNGDVIATRINISDSTKTLVRINKIGDIFVIPTDNANYFHASVSPDGQEMVFISDKDGDGNQVYLGALVDPFAKEFKSKPFFLVPSPTKHFEQTQTFCNMANEEVSIRPKLSKDGKWLMYGMAFTLNSCNQIFQLRLQDNDTSMPRKMTTGMHYFDSANFLGSNGEQDILYSGTLTKSVNPENIDLSCRIRLCYNDSEEYKSDPKLQNLCSQIGIEKGLPKESDLYIANQYGHIKSRVTNDMLYNGEAVVSPDFKTVIFAKETDDDFELFEIKLNGTSSKQITKSLGFEGGPTFNADGNLLAFYGWRPTETQDVERFINMKAYGFTDIKFTQIYIYNLKTNVETQITNSSYRCYSPVFLPTINKLLYINEDKNNIKMLMQADLTNFTDGIMPKSVKLDTLNHSISDISFGSTFKNLVYVSHSMKNTYDITVGQFVDQNSSSRTNFSNFYLAFICFWWMRIYFDL